MCPLESRKTKCCSVLKKGKTFSTANSHPPPRHPSFSAFFVCYATAPSPWVYEVLIRHCLQDVQSGVWGFHPGMRSVTSVQGLVAASVSISYDTHGNSAHSFPYRLRSDAGNILSYLWSSLGGLVCFISRMVYCIWQCHLFIVFISGRCWYVDGLLQLSVQGYLLCLFLADTALLMVSEIE